MVHGVFWGEKGVSYDDRREDFHVCIEDGVKKLSLPQKDRTPNIHHLSPITQGISSNASSGWKGGLLAQGTRVALCALFLHSCFVFCSCFCF